MNDNRRQILDMLAGGKITADEAERLLAALDREPGQTMGRVPRRLAECKHKAVARKRAPQNICACSSRPMRI